MPLRKPSEFFNDEKPKSSLDVVKEQLNSAAPEKLETISEAFDSFKVNFNHLQKLTDFTNSFDSFALNVERVNDLSESVEKLRLELDDFIKKEDLDDAMLAQIFFIEQSIRDLQEKVKSINSDTLIEIQENLQNISEKVDDFVEVQSLNHKKSLVDSESRIDHRFTQHKELVDTKVEQLEDDIAKRFFVITETLHGINDTDLELIKNEVGLIDQKVDDLIEKELPSYKKFFAETELKTEKAISDSQSTVETRLNEIASVNQTEIESLKSQLNDFIENEIPKFRTTLTEVRFQSEEEVNKISEEVNSKLIKAYQDIEILQEEFKNKEKNVDTILSEKILEIKQYIQESKSEIDSANKAYENLNRDFKNREIYENKKLEDYSQTLNNFSSKLQNLEETLNEEVYLLQGNLDISTSKYYDVLKKEVGYFEQNISEKLKDLEINFVRNETHIQDARKDLQEAISKLNIDELQTKNQNIIEKITQLEEILEKFDDKKILSEDASLTLAEPPNVKTSDPLTPLDQNYVTLKDLQDHYRLFINRVQQQLATIGGGGAGYVKDLSDVSFDESTGTNKLLIYNGVNWVGIASTALSGTTALVNLTDVDTSNLGDGRFLRYNASDSKFTFAPISATNLELIAGDIQSGILTTSSTDPAVVMSISASTYRSANYQIQVTEGTNYNMTTINVIHDGTTTYMTEYGTINQPIGVATFSSDISGGALRLIGYPAFASQTTFKVVFTAIET